MVSPVLNISFRANKMPKKEAEYLNSKLLSAKSVDIFCHSSTDEDCFNSAKIMYEYLNKNGVRPRIISSNGKDNYGYNPAKYNIIQADNMPKDIKKSDVALCVDFSAPERIPKGAVLYLRSFDKEDILSIDHHHTQTPITEDYVLYEKSYDDAPKLKEPKNIYIDSTSKSACAIVTRFFEALKIKMTKSQKEAGYCGMIDDMDKFGYIKLGGTKKLNKTKRFEADKNTQEVFNSIERSIPKEKREEIIKHVDSLSSLNKKEQAFRKNLYKNMQITKNGKFAYVIIDADNKEWEEIGGDNSITSTILRDFRTRTLKHKEPDEFLTQDDIEKLKDVEAAAVFYPARKTGTYRVSMHSNKSYVEKIFNYVRTYYNNNLIAGGHSNRGGGGMNGFDKKENGVWINDIIQAAENIRYND